jgi:hypothetical protein
MTYPTVTIVLLTYDRMEAAEPTLRAALGWIRYSGPLVLHIADDGSPEGYVEQLRKIAGHFPQFDTISQTNAERGGYGTSYNLATQRVHLSSEIILPLEDDWELQRPLDLDPLVETLTEEGSAIRCIRLGYIGYTQRLRGEFRSSPAGHMLLLDPDSDEPHVFAGHPRLETREFEIDVGPWPEHIPAGATEFEVAKRPAARVGVAWPASLIRAVEGDLFAHIGTKELGELWPGQE